MTRLNLLLAIAVVVELAGGAFVLFRPPPAPTPPTPPVPDLSTAVDPLVADRIRELAEKCRTPNDWAALGETYHAYGYFAEGEACYRYARDQEPENADRQYYWAFAVERIGRPDQAVAGYEQAIRLGHRDPDGCWYCVGQNHLRMQDTESARVAFEKAGHYLAARYERARLLVRAGKLDEAVTLLDRIAAESTTAVEPSLLRHKIEVLRDNPAAIVYADRAKRVFGRLTTPLYREWIRLEDAHERIGLENKLAEARKMIANNNWLDAESIVEGESHGEWDPEVSTLLAAIKFHNGQPAEAAQLLQEVADRAGPSALVLDALGDAMMAMGQPKNAMQAWKHATDLGIGQTAKAPHHKLADHYRKAGNTSDANWHESRSNLAAGHELFWAGRYIEARPLFEEAVKLDPRFAAAWFYLGESARLLDRPDEARSTYRRCLDIDPNFGRAHTALVLLDMPTAKGK